MSIAKPIFALGPDKRYLFWSRSKVARNRLPAQLQETFDRGVIQNILCVAFGDDDDKWLVLYEARSESRNPIPSIEFGPGIPPILRYRLADENCQLKSSFGNAESLKIVLGPGDSFMVWDRGSGIWENVPPELDAVLKGWAPDGVWRSGSPRHVALGADDAFLVVPLNGKPVYYIPETWPRLNEEVARTWTARMHYGQIWKHASFFSFSPCTPDTFTMVFASRLTANILLPTTTLSPEQKHLIHDLETIARTLGPCDIRTSTPTTPSTNPRTTEAGWKTYTRTEEAKWADQAQRTREAFSNFDAFRSASFANQFRTHPHDGGRSARIQRQKDLYNQWSTSCDAAFAQGDITEFPQLPDEACTCLLAGCKISRQETGLNGCRHDVETVLKGCDGFSVKWLRAERTKWHPDQFAKRCEVGRRTALERPAREMFSIFGMILEEWANV